MEKRSFRSVPARLALLALAMLGAALLSLCLGAAAVSPREILSVLSGGGRGTTAASILLYVRLPRTLGCLLAGAALAVSGAVIQTVLANPLAAPNIIGVNSGAGLGVGQIATVMGRYYDMDRDKRWDRVQKAYDAIACGEGTFEADAAEAVQKSYDAGVTDEFVVPVVCVKNAQVRDNDSIIFFNFRPDRAREISRCFVDEDFTDIQRRTGFLSVDFVCTTEYDATLPNVTVAYPHQKLVNTFGEYISKLGLTQLRIAETEKYAHVTFFFNGGVEEVFPGEDRCLIPSQGGDL